MKKSKRLLAVCCGLALSLTACLPDSPSVETDGGKISLTEETKDAAETEKEERSENEKELSVILDADDSEGIENAIDAMGASTLSKNLNSAQLTITADADFKDLGTADKGLITEGYAGNAKAKPKEGDNESDEAVYTRNIFDSDDRITLDYESRTSFPYRAVVYIQTRYPLEAEGQYHEATGAMISPDTVLTCAHCIYHPEAGGWPDSVRVIPAMGDDSWPYGYAEGEYVSVSNEYYTSANIAVMDDDEAWYGKTDYGQDIGYIKLDTRLGEDIGWFGWRYKSDSWEGTQVISAGYPLGNSEIAVYGTIDDDDHDNLFFTFATEKGQSGSPIFIEDNGNYQIIGIVSASNIFTNCGVRLTDEKWSWIYSYAFSE